MAALTLALGSALLWGLADFLGGLKSRTFPVAVVLAGMYLTSLAIMVTFVLVRGEGLPSDEAVAASLGAGLFGILGLAAFYRALSIGTMSIVAPIAATGVALPVVVGIASGERPSLLASIGLAAAVVGIVLASREDDGGPVGPREQRLSILLAIAAGIGFGTYFVLAEIGSDADIAWALALSRVSATPFIVAFALLALRRGGLRPRGRQVAAIVAIGLLDLGANAAYNWATTLGELSTVAVAASLYPVVTVFMAALVLGERVRGVQRAGVIVALGGVLLIAAGA